MNSRHGRSWTALGEALRGMRKTRGLSQAVLAGRLGRDQTYVSAIEHNREGLSLDRLGEILEVLKCDVMDLGVAMYEARGEVPPTGSAGANILERLETLETAVSRLYPAWVPEGEGSGGDT